MIVGGFNKVREALHGWVSGQTFTETGITFEHRNFVVAAAEKSAQLKVVVAPTTVPIDAGTRTSPQRNWRCRFHVVQLIASATEDETRDRQDALMQLVDEIEQKVDTDLRDGLDIDGRKRSVRIVTDNPRASMDEAAMLQHNTFWASVEVEVIDA